MFGKSEYVLSSDPKSHINGSTMSSTQLQCNSRLTHDSINTVWLTGFYLSNIPKEYIGLTGVLTVKFDSFSFTRSFRINSDVHDEPHVPLEVYNMPINSNSNAIMVSVTVGNSVTLNPKDTNMWVSMIVEKSRHPFPG